MNILFLLSRVGIAANDAADAAEAVSDFAKEHEKLQGMLDGLKSLGEAFGTIADSLYTLPVDVSKSELTTAISGIGAGLVTFFMVLEIITYCFNIDFHAGFESAMKIGVKTVLMYIIVDNCMSGAEAVIEVFKLNNTVDFKTQFGTISDPIADLFTNIEFSDGIFGMIEPILYGVVLVFLYIAVIVLFSMMIISLIGLIMETAVLTAVSPVACSTLVNSQVRQTGISALKNLAAISLQWSVIALAFTVYNDVASKIDLSSIATGKFEFLGKFLAVLAPLLCLAGLAAMISKSGEITRRALGA